MTLAQPGGKLAQATAARRRPALRSVPAAALCAAALAVAGCGSGTSGGTAGNTGGSGSGMQQVPAGEALSLAATQAQKVTSFKATMIIASGGTVSSHLAGTLEEQVKPTVLAHQKLSVSSNGTAVPGGLETVLTGDAVYLKMSTLKSAVGKPWVKISFASLKHTAGVSLAPLIRQLQSNNPLAQTQMLPAAKNVRRVGSATVAGVPTTSYSGSFSIAAAMAKLGPGLRKLMSPALAATGIKSARFTVWIDSQHLIRKLVEHESGPSYHVTTVMIIKSVNQPVHVSPPPASQVASLPGM